MAIVPKTVYEAQTDAADPGYPHGKAQNQSGPGDTNGTPLEALWLNDLWGFQQALLAEANLTPSDAPDKVGASQYLDAIRAMITGAMTTLRGGANTWAALQTFAAAIAITGTVSAQSFMYPAPVQRTVMVPLSSFVPTGSEDGGAAWSYLNMTVPDGTFAQGFYWLATERSRLTAQLKLPHGAIFKSARAYVATTGASLYAERFRWDKGGAGPTRSSLLLAGRATDGILESAPEFIDATKDFVGATDVLQIGILNEGTTRLHWVEVTFMDPGPRNF